MEIFATEVSPDGRNYKYISTGYTPWLTTVVSVTEMAPRFLVRV